MVYTEGVSHDPSLREGAVYNLSPPYTVRQRPFCESRMIDMDDRFCRKMYLWNTVSKFT